MASGVVKAVVDKYAGIGAAHFPGGTRPAIHAFRNVTGAGGALPVVVITGEKVRRERLDAAEVMETSTLAVEIYAEAMADCDTVLAAMLYAGGAVGDGDGFEDGDLTGLSTGYRLNSMCRADDAEDRGFAQWGPTAQRVHKLAWSLKVEVIAGSF